MKSCAWWANWLLVLLLSLLGICVLLVTHEHISPLKAYLTGYGEGIFMGFAIVLFITVRSGRHR